MNYRLLGIVAILVCVVSITALILAVILRGGVSTSAPSIAALIAFLGLLVTSLTTVLGVRNVQATVVDVQTKLNGHLAKHAEAVDAAQVAATAAGSVAEQLEAARVLLEKIHLDTNSRFAESRQEVAALTAEVARLREGLTEPHQ